jgi:hypothetical protein
MRINLIEGLVQEFDTFNELSQSLKAPECGFLPMSALQESVFIRCHVLAFGLVLEKERCQLSALLISQGVVLPSSMTDTFEPGAIMSEAVDIL